MEHGGLIPLPLANDNAPLHRGLVEDMTHDFNGGLIGGILIALTNPGQAGPRGQGGRPDKMIVKHRHLGGELQARIGIDVHQAMEQGNRLRLRSLEGIASDDGAKSAAPGNGTNLIF